MRRVWTWVGVVAMAATGFGQTGGDRLTPEALQNFAFRSIGPSLTTGRLSDIAVDPKNPNVWYVAASAGNLWKTENRGNTWTPIFETYGSYSLGAVVVDPKNSNIVWLGTGENNNQRSVSYGDGIYKSTDAGATWTRVGLENSEHIQNILIDPRDSNVVYVSAIGPLWNAGGDRGLYKTTDGGKTWKAVLPISADTGVTDVVMDPKKPDVLYAAAYQRRRAVGQLIGGGPESGLYKTTDGGAKWTKLTKGLPTVEMGRIGLGINWKNPNTVYALVTAQRGQGGFFRSDDAGASWTRIGRIRADCGRGGGRAGARSGDAAGRVRSARRAARRGAAAQAAPAAAPPTPARGAPHRRAARRRPRRSRRRLLPRRRSRLLQRDLRRRPRSRNHLVTADADVAQHRRRQDLGHGADGRRSRRPSRDRLRPDGQEPHHHRQRRRPLRDLRRHEDVAALHQPAAVAVLPGQHRQRAAVLQRLRRRAGQRLDLRPVAHAERRPASAPATGTPSAAATASRAAAIPRIPTSSTPSRRTAPSAARSAHRDAPEHASARSTSRCSSSGAAAPAAQGGGQGGGRGAATGRWHWDSPLIISPHSAAALYFAGERVYRSDDRGDNWTAISGDLTRNLDPATIPIMGKVWPPDSVAFNQATTTLSTITALDESPLLEGLIYVGTRRRPDAGHRGRRQELAEDREAARPCPSTRYVTDLFASPRDANVVFATFNNYQRGNFKPYV